jgi:hypothetical protein
MRATRGDSFSGKILDATHGQRSRRNILAS